MLAHKIIEGVNAPLPMTPPEQLMKYHHSPLHQGGGWVKCDTGVDLQQIQMEIFTTFLDICIYLLLVIKVVYVAQI